LLISCAIRNYYLEDTSGQLQCIFLNFISLKNPLSHSDLLSHNIIKIQEKKYRKDGSEIIRNVCHPSNINSIINFTEINPDTIYSYESGTYLNSKKLFNFTIHNENIVLEKVVYKDFIISVPENNLKYYLIELEFEAFHIKRNEYIYIENTQ
jgi:hypothetical protein